MVTRADAIALADAIRGKEGDWCDCSTDAIVGFIRDEILPDLKLVLVDLDEVLREGPTPEDLERVRQLCRGRIQEFTMSADEQRWSILTHTTAIRKENMPWSKLKP